VQEVCNALFDVLFNILPLGTELDRVDPTLARVARVEVSPWDEDAQHALDEYLESQPILVRISAAKQLRDRVEREARVAGEGRVTAARVCSVRAALAAGRAA